MVIAELDLLFRPHIRFAEEKSLTLIAVPWQVSEGSKTVVDGGGQSAFLVSKIHLFPLFQKVDSSSPAGPRPFAGAIPEIGAIQERYGITGDQ